MSEQRGRPFEPGNTMGRGRPKGSRNKKTAQAQAILDQFTEPLVKKCVAKALAGDGRAMALCMERILPSGREPGLRIKIPKLDGIGQIDQSLQRIVEGIANGRIPIAPGEQFHAILQNHRDNVYSREMEARLIEVEKRAPPPTEKGGRR
jgi:hypothetical protein